MAKARTIHRCRECGAIAARWQGRCPSCDGWNTLDEERQEAGSSASAAGSQPAPRAVPIADVEADGCRATSCGLAEVDRVLGGGLVPGSVTLIGGEPGIGKSTLVLQIATSMATHGLRVLYIAAEESAAQIRARAERLGAVAPGLWIVPETSLAHLATFLDDVAPDLVLVDSVQAVQSPEVSSAPGSVTQVRESALRLVAEAKRRQVATVLVGHVTKDGLLAGPRVLEHLVDTVLSFEGDRGDGLRLLRAAKHRFGSTSEVGVFEMGDAGLTAVVDPSGRFLSDRRAGIPGSVVTATLEGRRPILVEVQALVGSSPLASPRRTAQGIDGGRLALLLAVLERRCGFGSLARVDVHILAVGGVRISEPGADLAITLAIASALSDTALPADLVAFGEVGLGGEVRRVSRTAERVAEAQRLGYRRVLRATEPDAATDGDRSAAGTLLEALRLANLPVVEGSTFAPADHPTPSGQ